MLKGANIVFDLDGTLVDTAPDLTSALNHALTRHGHLAVSAATVRYTRDDRGNLAPT
jgi:phosphoglycolate phosphatase